MAYVVNTLENQSIVLKTWGRGRKAGNNRFHLPLNGVKIEEINGGRAILTFIDPFTQKEVKVSRNRGSYYNINREDKKEFDRFGIPGFGGFTDIVKRKRKKKNTTTQKALLTGQNQDVLSNAVDKGYLQGQLGQFVGQPLNQSTLGGIKSTFLKTVDVAVDLADSTRVNVTATYVQPWARITDKAHFNTVVYNEDGNKQEGW